MVETPTKETMETIILQRYMYYSYDVQNHLVEYDYSIGYINYDMILLGYNADTVRFASVLKALKNETKETFYKIKYSDFERTTLIDPNRIKMINDYLLDVGGE